MSRGKRASIFGGFLGKKDKSEDKAEQKKEEHKVEGEASKVQPEIKDDAPVVAPVAESKPHYTVDALARMLTSLSFNHCPSHHPGPS